MTTVVVSPKFQVVIPKLVRENLNINKGMKLEVVAYKGQILLIPIKSIKEFRGKFKGMNTIIIREKDRNL